MNLTELQGLRDRIVAIEMCDPKSRNPCIRIDGRLELVRYENEGFKFEGGIEIRRVGPDSFYEFSFLAPNMQEAHIATCLDRWVLGSDEQGSHLVADNIFFATHPEFED